MKKLSTAALMIALLASPALAATDGAPFPGREAVSIKVSTDNLDPNSARDQARLRQRIQRAIAAACNHADDANAIYSSYSPDRQCYQEMAMNAESKMQMFAQSGYTRSAGTVAAHTSTAKD